MCVAIELFSKYEMKAVSALVVSCCVYDKLKNGIFPYILQYFRRRR